MLDDGTDRPGVTWLITGTALLPTLVVQEFTRISLLPKLDKFCQLASIPDGNLQPLQQAVHVLTGHAASVIPALIVLILLLEWIVKPSKQVRNLGAAMIAVGYNTAVLLGVVAAAVLFAVTGPEIDRRELAPPAMKGGQPSQEGAPTPTPAR